MAADPFRPLKQRLHEMAQTWQPLFGLDDYEIAFEWWDRAWDEHQPNSVMHTTASWCYKWATIKVNLVLASGRSRQQLERDLLHEIGHVLCALLPAQTDGGDGAKAPIEEERLVTDLAQAVQRIAKAFYERGKAAIGG